MSKLWGRRLALEFTVFVCGAVVMIFEIIGSRILSPFIGTSTYVWTSLIGVILGSLSLGYWIGGRTADRAPDVRSLAAVIFVAGAMISLTVLFKEVVLSMVASLPVGIELRSLVAALMLFAPASVCLGFVTPYAIRLRISTVAEAGRTIGRLYALSTVGSIIGTFAAGFFLIPFVGSVRTLYSLAAILILLPLVLVPMALSRTVIAIPVLFIVSVVASEGNAYLLRQASDMYDRDTQYSRVQVFRTTDPKSGKPIRALATDPYFAQSAIFLDSDEPVFEYSHYYRLAAAIDPDMRHVLVIGGAGYSVPKDLLARDPEVNVDVVEIDPGMTEIARKFFRLREDPRLKIIHEDGRTFLRRVAAKKYDAIMMDAFGSLFSVPYQLTTVEAVNDMARVLSNDGVVIFNLGSAITGDASKFLAAELMTYRSVFARVDVYKVNSDYPDDRLQNLIIVAYGSAASEQPPLGNAGIERLLNHRVEVLADPSAQILTDDLAPVEYFNSIAQNIYLSER